MGSTRASLQAPNHAKISLNPRRASSARLQEPCGEWPHHDGEDDGGHGGFEDPEDGQADDLHQREEVDATQRHVPEEDVVGLVLGRHEEELAAVPELRWDEGRR